MYSQNDKKESHRLSYTLFLFGFFYLVIRLIAECFIQFSLIGRRAFILPLHHQTPERLVNRVIEVFQDSPFLITLTDITAAVMAVVAIISICLALASKASSIRGLKNSALFFLLFGCILPFHHRSLMYLMQGFLVMFYVFLSFSSYIKVKYPKYERRRTVIGIISFIILFSYLLAFICVSAKESHRFGNSIPLVPDSVTKSDGQYTDGMFSFEQPPGWSLDTLIYSNDSFPVSYFTDNGSDHICIYSSIMKDGGIDGHHMHVVMMCPHDISSKDSLLSIERVKVNNNDVFHSSYLHRDSLYVNVATVFDKRSRKATTFLTASADSTEFSLLQMAPILETVSFDLDGDLLEYQSVQQVKD